MLPIKRERSGEEENSSIMPPAKLRTQIINSNIFFRMPVFGPEEVRVRDGGGEGMLGIKRFNGFLKNG